LFRLRIFWVIIILLSRLDIFYFCRPKARIFFNLFGVFSIVKTKIRKIVQVRTPCKKSHPDRCFINRVISSSPSSLVIFAAGESDDCATLSLTDRKSPTTFIIFVDRPTHKTSWDFFSSFSFQRLIIDTRHVVIIVKSGVYI